MAYYVQCQFVLCTSTYPVTVAEQYWYRYLFQGNRYTLFLLGKKFINFKIEHSIPH